MAINDRNMWSRIRKFKRKFFSTIEKNEINTDQKKKKTKKSDISKMRLNNKNNKKKVTKGMKKYGGSRGGRY